MAASSASCVASSSNVPELPETPHQPRALSFRFPKRYYGKKSTVACTFQSGWFKSWPFLHYDEAQDVVFCHTCVKAFSLKRMITSSASCVASSSNVPELPETPHQPRALSFRFPKRYYGKKSTVACTFQSGWFKSWPFLHYDEAQDVVFCHTCVKAFSLKRMITSHTMQPQPL